MPIFRRKEREPRVEVILSSEVAKRSDVAEITLGRSTKTRDLLVAARIGNRSSGFNATYHEKECRVIRDAAKRLNVSEEQIRERLSSGEEISLYVTRERSG